MTRPPKGEVWAGYIDHALWHVLVNVGTLKVVRWFRPHMRGTLRVYYKRGQEELRALAEMPSVEMLHLCKQQRAALGKDGRLCACAPDDQTLRAELQRELARIDAATTAKLAEGVVVENGKSSHSLSANALAKLDALIGAGSFPATVSSIDNLASIVLNNLADAERLREIARARLAQLLAEGDRLKAAARSRAALG